MIFKTIIEKVDNGYIVTDEVDGGVEAKYVFSDEDEFICMVNMLHQIKANFGLHGSKHDERRIFVEIVNQHEEAPCPFCS